ncbi:MAG: DUF29 domain-containing protein [Xenococcus sp. (in: cyanobacteria)]
MTYDIDQDYDLWLQEQANLLRSRSFDKLDLNNLIEELEALVRGEKSAVESFTYQVILHLLLVDYWQEESERNRNYGQAEVSSFQFQLSNKITTNLLKHLARRLPKLYSRARKTAILKTGLNQRFPENCPYALEDILEEEET